METSEIAKSHVVERITSRLLILKDVHAKYRAKQIDFLTIIYGNENVNDGLELSTFLIWKRYEKLEQTGLSTNSMITTFQIL